MEAIHIRQIMEKDGEVQIKGLPYKRGQTVEVVVSIQPTSPSRLTVGRFRKSGLIGLWRDRDDIDDSASYARQLREQAQQRGGHHSDPAR